MRQVKYSPDSPTVKKVVACDEFEYCDTHCHLKHRCDIWIKEKKERVVFT